MTDLVYQSSKTYTHAQGFSCCFRQHKAESHCNKLHGYALKVEVVFEGDLDERNWVVDFGALKGIKNLLENCFDHTTLIAEDDPYLETFQKIYSMGLIDLVIMPGVGCEKFAEHLFRTIEEKIGDDVIKINPGARLMSVQVWEHEANSAKVIRKDTTLAETLEAMNASLTDTLEQALGSRK